MANIFKTKEMYKNIAPTTRITPLRKVRGVYVTGPYRPPHYIDHTLTIVSIGSTKATIAKYTEASETAQPDYAMAWTDIRESSALTIDHMTTKTEHLNSDYAMAWIDIRESIPLLITKYSKLNVDPTPDYAMAWIGVYESSPLLVERTLPYLYVDIPPGDTLLNILNMESTKATITTV